MSSRSVSSFLLLVLAGCSSQSANMYDPDPLPPDVVPVAVELTAVRQRIDGFGASSAWTTPQMTDEQGEMFFSVDKGIGLTHLRLRIAPDGTTGELVTAQKAVALGIKVWAAVIEPALRE